MASNSQVHPRGTRPSALRAPVAVNTNRSADGFSTLTLFTSTRRESKRDGEQAWMWTFRTEKHTLYAVRESRGSDVPVEVLGEDFAGTVICDGWTAYPAFSEELQRCWAHILREAETPLKTGRRRTDLPCSQTVVRRSPDPTGERLDSARAEELQRVARRELESLIERSVPDGPVATLLGKIEGGLDHWLTFVGEPAVSPTNNAAESALREPVVLRKIIGTPGMIEECSFTRRSCPCWRRGASRDAIPTKSFVESSAATR